jgi:hypothetical protein
MLPSVKSLTDTSKGNTQSDCNWFSSISKFILPVHAPSHVGIDVNVTSLSLKI